jgi:hypothetical protein
VKSQVFELKLEAIRNLCLFVLRKILDQPSDWVGIGKEYQGLCAFEDDALFNQAFVRLFTLMREEGWIGSSPDEQRFLVGLTQVGSEVGGGDFERADESFLKVLGYTVGKTNGLPESTRHLILDRCFSGQLPPIESLSALRLWGEPKTALRLRKIAYHIAGLAKNFKKMPSGGYETAISEWEDDLQYLYETYYVRHFGFNWPSRIP